MSNAFAYHNSFHDRDESAVHKFKKTYYTAKQTLRSRLGRKEDDYLLASDAEIDAKLEVFYAIKKSCDELRDCIENYQDYICELSQEESSMGRFLKKEGKNDKTQAGKMMAAVGMVSNFTAKARLALRVPLVRLYSELEVFIGRAVQDTQFTVDAMERARTEYRGSLLWMKNVSEQLDPDRYGRMESFRTVQAQVKSQKAKYDKLKLDCLQKIDLLTASRCNLFSLVLATYQNTLVHFWNISSQAHERVAEQFKGYQHYEFTIVKDLIEPSRRLAEQTRNADSSEGKEAPQQQATSSDIDSTCSLISLEKDLGTDELKDFFKEDSSPNDSPTHTAATEPLSKEEAAISDLLSMVQEKRAARQPTEAATAAAAEEAAMLEDLFRPAQGSLLDDWETALAAHSQSTTMSANLNDSPEHKAGAAASAGGPGSSLLPSQLLDLQQQQGMPPPRPSAMATTQPGVGDGAATSQQQRPQQPGDDDKKRKLDAWFSLFAEIDPLQNPDAIGNPNDCQRNA